MYQIGPFEDVGWTRNVLPEIVWIALLHDHLGWSEGAALALKLAKAADKAGPQGERRTNFASASDYAKLNADAVTAVRAQLGEDLRAMSTALRPLGANYPSFPMQPLLGVPAEVPAKQDLDTLRRVLAELFDRRTVQATRLQATVVYLSSCLELLVVHPSTSLAEFPEIEKYPETEKSLRVAASMRALINSMFGAKKSESWPGQFWNRGLELEPCKLSEDHE